MKHVDQWNKIESRHRKWSGWFWQRNKGNSTEQGQSS